MNPSTSPIVRIANGLLELGWLFILVAVPNFFNVRDLRVFEPDKIVLLRNVVLAMVVVYLFKMLYAAPYYLARWTAPLEAADRASFWKDLGTYLRQRPTVIAALAFAIIYILATVQSLLPTISFWGSYDRMEGTYTYLSYITLFLLMLSHMRTWAQFERLATAVILASVPVSAYSWLQHFNGDPLSWGGSSDSAAARTPSTLGNPIFLAAYLLMAVPFTLHRIVGSVLRLWQSAVGTYRPAAMGEYVAADRLRRTPAGGTTRRNVAWQEYLGLFGYIVALVMQLGAILFSGSRGPALGFLAAVLIFIFAIAVRRHIVILLRIGVVAFIGLALVLGATNTVLKRADTPGSGAIRFLYLLPSESGTSEVRSLLWGSAPDLFKAHPLLGCGPEVLLFCWYPYYPTGLRSVELANAAPDRSHDEEIDVLLTSGLLGELAYLAFLGSSLVVMVRLIRRSTDMRSLTFSVALISAFAGHIVEGTTGIAFSATLVMLWALSAAATALDVGDPAGAAGSYPRSVVVDTTIALQDESVEAASPRGKRQDSRRQSRNMTSSRRTWDEPLRYSFLSGLARTSGLGTGILILGAIVSAVLVVLACMQFVANIALIQADVDYRLGTQYEVAAGNNTSQASQLPTAEATYQGAIAAFQDALNTVPKWNNPPPQDTYNLFLGKTYLEYANALELDLKNKVSANVTFDQVQSALQSSADAFVKAAHDNPLNPDHPRNLAKLYLEWASYVSATPDLAKLKLSNSYFAKASSLAPHNSDILDEWTQVNMAIGDNYPSLTKAQYTDALAHLNRALELYPGNISAIRDLGFVYNRFGQMAADSHQAAKAKQYYTLAKQYWTQALAGGATQAQRIYPRLAYLLYSQFKDYCGAGQNSVYGLQAIRAGTLPDADGGLAKGFQQLIDLAKSHRCTLTGQ